MFIGFGVCLRELASDVNTVDGVVLSDEIGSMGKSGKLDKIDDTLRKTDSILKNHGFESSSSRSRSTHDIEHDLENDLREEKMLRSGHESSSSGSKYTSSSSSSSSSSRSDDSLEKMRRSLEERLMKNGDSTEEVHEYEEESDPETHEIEDYD